MSGQPNESKDPDGLIFDNRIRRLRTSRYAFWFGCTPKEQCKSRGVAAKFMYSCNEKLLKMNASRFEVPSDWSG